MDNNKTATIGDHYNEEIVDRDGDRVDTKLRSLLAIKLPESREYGL